MTLGNDKLLLVGAGAALVVIVAAGFAAREAQKAAGQAVGTVADALNPANPDNVFSQGVNAVTKAVTGEPTFGGWLASVFNPAVRVADAAASAPIVMAEFRDPWDLLRDRTIVYQPPVVR